MEVTCGLNEPWERGKLERELEWAADNGKRSERREDAWPGEG